MRSLCSRSQPTKSSTSALRHIQEGKRLKSDSASTASASLPVPRTKRLTRQASGKSASAATPRKPFSTMSRLVSSARRS